MEQMINLTESEMLAMWKRLMHIDVVRRECVIERDDGIMLDDVLIHHIRQWYAHLLLTAPLHWLPIDDVGAQVQLSVDDDGVVTAVLPESFVRPVEWKLAGWKHSVTVFVEPDSQEALRQCSPWLRGGCANPVIVKYDDRLMLYSVEPGTSPVLVIARCVAVPSDNRYMFHHDALETLPKWNESILQEC